MTTINADKRKIGIGSATNNGEKTGSSAEFIRQLRSLRYLNIQPDTAPNPNWKVFYGDSWDTALYRAKEELQTNQDPNNVDSKWRQARDVTRGVAYDTAPKLIAEWDTAFNDARDSAVELITTELNRHNISGHAKLQIAKAAALDAGLRAAALAISNESFPNKDEVLAHTEDRFDAWCRGYVVLMDINGQLQLLCTTVLRQPAI